VTIDGDRSSSPRQRRGRRRGLGFGRGFTGAHLGLLGMDLAVAFGCGVSEKGRRCHRRGEHRSGVVLGLLLHLQTLQRGRRWRRLLSVLALEKYRVSIAWSLGSQREGGERPAASQVTTTFPFLPRPRQILR
jgi:hypothetical protein